MFDTLVPFFGDDDGGGGDVSLLKGALAGLAGGLVASWVMNQFQEAVPADRFGEAFDEVDDLARERLGLGADGGQQQQQGSDDEAEPATVQAADALSTRVLGRELQEREKRWAGPAVHYSFGGAHGALYGALAEVRPGVTRGAGLPFGAVFWLVADEALVPALGLSQSPTAYPPSNHAYALASHLVYGLTAEGVRRVVRAVL